MDHLSASTLCQFGTNSVLYDEELSEAAVARFQDASLWFAKLAASQQILAAEVLRHKEVNLAALKEFQQAHPVSASAVADEFIGEVEKHPTWVDIQDFLDDTVAFGRSLLVRRALNPVEEESQTNSPTAEKIAVAFNANRLAFIPAQQYGDERGIQNHRCHPQCRFMANPLHAPR